MDLAKRLGNEGSAIRVIVPLPGRQAAMAEMKAHGEHVLGNVPGSGGEHVGLGGLLPVSQRGEDHQSK